uniref:Uncharacterized protein n=1 Tax=Oryza barthii TaxID=65489 RepID=A0A0D3HP55_9ORYZ
MMGTCGNAPLLHRVYNQSPRAFSFLSSPKHSIVQCDSANSSRGDVPSPSLLPCSSTAQRPGDGEKRRPRQPVREGVRLSSTLSSHLVLGATALLVVDC